MERQRTARRHDGAEADGKKDFVDGKEGGRHHVWGRMRSEPHACMCGIGKRSGSAEHTTVRQGASWV